MTLPVDCFLNGLPVMSVLLRVVITLQTHDNYADDLVAIDAVFFLIAMFFMVIFCLYITDAITLAKPG